MSKITKIWSREILDSRGVPTLETFCALDNGLVSASSVPAGASTGTHESLELRDEDNPRYLGKGVLKAVNNVNTILGPRVLGLNPQEQFKVDQKLVEIDGTENKSKYGANSILSISESVCKAGAMDAKTQLYNWIFKLASAGGITKAIKVPTPLFNMINGGLHGAGNLDFQEFWVIPASNKTFSEGLRIGVEVYHTIGENLSRRGAIHSVGDEGGYAPNLFTNADALEIFVESIKQSNYALGRDVFLGLDVASNSFFKNGEYSIKDKASPMDEFQMVDYYKNLLDQYKLAALEDPFQEDAWSTWQKFTQEMGQQVIIIGDDLLATNPKRVQKAINEKSCNAVLVKPNQVGTVTESFKVIKMARDAGWKIVVSHRSGETNDSFIADFAAGVASEYAKFGAPARGERVAKYNRLAAIEYELPKSA